MANTYTQIYIQSPVRGDMFVVPAITDQDQPRRGGMESVRIGPPVYAAPTGLVDFVLVTQGSSCLATLGFEPESLWDSSLLALIQPDGKTVASAFAPSYPPQITDVSYGRSMLVNTEVAGAGQHHGPPARAE